MGSPRPICAPCRVTMYCAKNEVLVSDKKVDEVPSTYWFGDLYRCPACGAEIVTDFGLPISAEDSNLGRAHIVFGHTEKHLETD